MEKIYYNKLCRDKIPEIIIEKGFECEVREVDAEEYRVEILRKVHEEALGVMNSLGRGGLKKELADLLVTIEAVKKDFGITDEEMEGAIKSSLDEKGGYEDRYYLSWSSDIEYVARDHNGPRDD